MENINKHNYEEYFMLYLDNELNDQQRKAVEAFVILHPELKPELEMLKNVQLSPDEIQFSNKEILHRNGTENINASNYQTHFLLFTDNELDNAGKTQVEKFVLQNPALQEEFLSLQKTKLPMEAVIFTDKELLFRTEKERKIVPIFWMRMGVAAAVMGLVAALWFLVPKDTQVATGNEMATATLTENVLPFEKTNNNTIEKKADENLGSTTPKTLTAKIEDKANAVSIRTAKNNMEVAVAVSVNANDKKIDNGNLNNLPTPVSIAKLQNKKVEQSSVAPDEEIKNNTIASVKNNNQPLDEPIVKTAVYRDMVMEDNGNNDGILIGSANINKDKLKSLFKKAVNFLDIKKPKIESEDNTIQIASFKFNTK